MHLTRLRLTGFRNHVDTDLSLTGGLVVVTGHNGAGKSALLEGVHMLSVGKSVRARTDRELVNHSVAASGGHVQVLGIFNEGADSTRAQIDMDVAPIGEGGNGRLRTLAKEWRVNGVTMKAVEFVGQTNSILFEARDLELVYGGAAVRRRYMNILIGQFDTEYLQALIRLRHVQKSRNALLRGIYEGADPEEEMPYWDERFRDESLKIVQTRREVMSMLQERAGPIYGELSGGESLSIQYVPSLSSSGKSSVDWEELDIEGLRQHIYDCLVASKARERATGRMVMGPQLDDFSISLNGVEARRYASRGQARSLASALRLAEASLVTELVGRKPIIAFDDVLSEMDASRRGMILEHASNYEQTILTATDHSQIPASHLRGAQRFAISKGKVRAL